MTRAAPELLQEAPFHPLHVARAYLDRLQRKNAGFELRGQKLQKRAGSRVAPIALALILLAVPNSPLVTTTKNGFSTGRKALLVPVLTADTSWPILNASLFNTGCSTRY